MGVELAELASCSAVAPGLDVAGVEAVAVELAELAEEGAVVGVQLLAGAL